MNAKMAHIILRAGFLTSPVMLAACGGGGAAECSNPNPAICAIVGSAPADSVGTAAELYTTATDTVTLAAGTGATYNVGGGRAPYTATSGNTNVAVASMSGATLAIKGVASGEAPILVVDSLGKSVSIALTVSAATSVEVTALYTTAPSSITLKTGVDATYTVAGGLPPYTATSGNVGVATALMSGSMLTIGSLAAGSAPIVIVDSAGKTIEITATVLAQGNAGQPLSLAPGALTIGDCTTNIPFVFSGGIAPYTVFTSDNFSVPVSSALPLGDKSYFTASIKALNPKNIIKPEAAPYTAVLTVLDSQSQSVTSEITVPAVHVTCPDNVLLQISPSSANFRPSEILAFQLAGGPSPAALPSISFSDPTVAVVALNTSGTSFSIQALKAGTTLMTVTTSDGQKSNVTLTVLPPAPQP